MGGGIAGRVLSLAAALAAACTVLAPSDDELMGGGSGAPEAGIGSASGTGAEAGTGKGGSPAGGGTHAGGTGGAPAGGTGGAPAGGTGGDSGAGGVPTGGSGGAPEGGVNPTVNCAGNGDCSPPGQYCCAPQWQKWQCLSAGAACNGGTQIYCDGPEDCATGQVCCADYAKLSSTYQKLSCAPKDTCAPEQEHRVVCGSIGKCPLGQSCKSSTLLPGYHVCSTPDAGVGGSGGTASGGTGGFGGIGGIDASLGGMAGTSG